MGSKRHVNKLLSVFDLTIWEALALPENVSCRVMFIYDKKQKLKRFNILNNGIPKEIHMKLTLWLEQNICVNDIAFGLKSNELNADDFAKSKTPL
jgi:hypothetical protein